jgi:hypothetical protein
MHHSRMSRPNDPDDWFGESARKAAKPDEAPPLEDDWVRGEMPIAARRRAPLLATPRARQIAAGAGAVLVLVLVLWGAGVFGGGGSSPTRTHTTTTQASATTASTPARALVRPPATTLTPGSTGVEVKRLQRALAQLGYAPGRVDGSYGPATENALKRFQRANGLQPDGVLGPKTLKSLKNKLAAG